MRDTHIEEIHEKKRQRKKRKVKRRPIHKPHEPRTREQKRDPHNTWPRGRKKRKIAALCIFIHSYFIDTRKEKKISRLFWQHGASIWICYVHIENTVYSSPTVCVLARFLVNFFSFSFFISHSRSNRPHSIIHSANEYLPSNVFRS